MTLPYDKYYQTENLFGDPYPELIDYFKTQPDRGKLLDLGCGQGRNAIALARLGYDVTGIDNSVVGIEQMQQVARNHDLNIQGIVADIYQVDDFSTYDFILLDSMFHFRKQELEIESALVRRIIEGAKKGTQIVFCIQDSGKKITVFKRILRNLEYYSVLMEQNLKYKYEDKESSHSSTTPYKMIVVKK